MTIEISYFLVTYDTIEHTNTTHLYIKVDEEKNRPEVDKEEIDGREDRYKN